MTAFVSLVRLAAVRRAWRVLLLFAPLWSVAGEPEQQLVVTDASFATAASRPCGFNLNYILDTDRRRPAGRRPLAETLQALRPGFLRYPGGEKSDHHLWSEPPFTQPRPTLLATGLGRWMARNAMVGAQADGHWPVPRRPMDTDEFLLLCRDVGAAPVFVVAYDAAWYDQEGKALTAVASQAMRNRLRESAVAWVRHVRARWTGPTWWEIGNEVDQGPIPDHPTAAAYADDVIGFADAMHAADPQACIGMCGMVGKRFKAHVDALAARQRLDAIDFLAAHSYPTWNWSGFDDWGAKRAGLVEEFRAATRIVQALPEPHRQRLRVAMTEVGLIDYSKKGWPNRNDLGHALVAADLIGLHLADPALLFVLWWNTRWFAAETATGPSSTDLLGRDNAPLPIAEALAAWGRVLDERMFRTEGTDQVRIHASGDAARTRLRLLLLHGGRQEQPVAIRLPDGHARFTRGTCRILSGRDPEDTAPVWRRETAVPVQAGTIRLILPPVSITVVNLAIP